MSEKTPLKESVREPGECRAMMTLMSTNLQGVPSALGLGLVSVGFCMKTEVPPFCPDTFAKFQSAKAEMNRQCNTQDF